MTDKKKLKHWSNGNTECGYGDTGIVLLDENEYDVFSISKDVDTGNFLVREECDGYYYAEFTKEELLDAMREAINWIELQ